MASVEAELPKQAKVDVEGLSSIPAVEQMLAMRINSLQCLTVETTCTRREPPLRRRSRDGLAGEYLPVFAGKAMDRVALRHQEPTRRGRPIRTSTPFE